MPSRTLPPLHSHPRSLYDGVSQRVYAALAGVVVASPLPEAAWYSAAEAALTALYALHPAPEHLSAAVLRHLARAAFAPAAEGAADGEQASVQQGDGAGGAEEGEEVEQGGEAMEADGAGADAADAADAADPAAAAEGEAGDGDGGEAPAGSQQGSQAPGSQAPRSLHNVPALSRFFFVLGHVALQHLVRPAGRRGREGSGPSGLQLCAVPLMPTAPACRLAQRPTHPRWVPAPAGLHRARRQGGAPHAPGAREEGGGGARGAPGRGAHAR